MSKRQVRPKRGRLGALDKRYHFCINQKKLWAARAEKAAEAYTALKLTYE